MSVTKERTDTLRSQTKGHEPLVFDPSVHHGYKEYEKVSETVRSRYGTGGNNIPMVVKAYTISSYESNVMKSNNPNTGIHETEKAKTLDLNGGNPACNQGGVMIVETNIDKPTTYANNAYDKWAENNVSSTLRAAGGVYGGGSESLIIQSESHLIYPDKTGSLMASGYSKLGTQEAMNGMYPVTENEENMKSVRRLTPMECERLQGFPDGWTDIPGASDSARYKALGNSIALPFWKHLAYRFADIGDVETIGSLFDGIGGFPLSFEEAGVKTLWTSEIEPFCEKVVGIRFGEEE